MSHNNQYPRDVAQMQYPKLPSEHQGWETAFKYAYDVHHGIRNASKAEQQFVQRFIDDCKRDDIELILMHCNFAIFVANSLKHSKGPIAGTYIQLMPWQIFLLVNLFGWHYNAKAGIELEGQRRFTKCLAFMARGNAKTQLAAIVSIVGLLLTTNGNPVCTTSASSRKQASIAFEEIKNQIKNSSKSIRSRFRLMSNEIRIVGGGMISSTSSEADNLDGLRVVVGIIDELHAHKDSKVHDAIASSQSSSRDPILFLITTAGTNTKSFCREMYDYAKDILAGNLENDRYLAIVYESDIDDHTSEIGFEQANPSIDKAVSRTSLRSEALLSQMSAGASAAFRTKHLNQWRSYNENSLIDNDLIEKAFIDNFPSDDKLQAMSSYAGLDLGATSDLTSIVSLHTDGTGTIYAKSKNFIPHKAFDELPKNYTKTYIEAINTGYLQLLGDIVTDLDGVSDALANMDGHYQFKEMGIDIAAGGIRFASNYENEHRRELTSVQQGFGLSDAIVEFIRLMSIGKIKFSSDDVMLRWCIENSRLRSGTKGDFAVQKGSNNNLKIDALIALLIALSLIPVVEYEYQIRRF